MRAPFAAMMVAALAISGCSREPSDRAQRFNDRAAEPGAESSASDASGTAVADRGPINQVCGSQETFESIRDVIFDEAIERSKSDPVPLNDLRRSVGVKMELPLVIKVDEELQRTDCSGRFILMIPPGARAAFGGDRELKADIEYFVQPSADGEGSVISTDGIGFMLRRLLSANLRRTQRAVVPESSRVATGAAEATSPTNGGGLKPMERGDTGYFNPSFDCSAKLNNVERMICSSGELARKDRQLSSAFKKKLARYSGSDRKALLKRQRGLLAQRGRCPDTACISTWYDRVLKEY